MTKRTRSYRKWESMIARCCRESHPSFTYYGGRGITVCQQWRDSYETFLADMGEAPEGMWLDRIDNEKGYEPGNCRWVTPKESARNRRKRQANPEGFPAKCKRFGMPYLRVYQRIRMGWPVEKALTVPIQWPGAMTLEARAEFGLPVASVPWGC